MFSLGVLPTTSPLEGNRSLELFSNGTWGSNPKIFVFFAHTRAEQAKNGEVDTHMSGSPLEDAQNLESNELPVH